MTNTGQQSHQTIRIGDLKKTIQSRDLLQARLLVDWERPKNGTLERPEPVLVLLNAALALLPVPIESALCVMCRPDPGWASLSGCIQATCMTGHQNENESSREGGLSVGACLALLAPRQLTGSGRFRMRFLQRFRRVSPQMSCHLSSLFSLLALVLLASAQLHEAGRYFHDFKIQAQSDRRGMWDTACACMAACRMSRI